MTSAPTVADVKALGVRTDLVTAYRVVVGGGKNRAWQAYHNGELPFPTLRVGRRVVVPVAPLLALLGIEPAEAPASTEAA
jgi:hypothetical protein